MTHEEVCVAATELVTAYGFGKSFCRDGLYAGRHAFRPVERFPVDRMRSRLAGCVADLRADTGESLLAPMFRFLADRIPASPGRSELFLASTVGEIDLLNPESSSDTLHSALGTALRIFRMRKGRILSAACASSNLALARAGEQIRNGMLDSVLVVGADLVSEFVFSGFSALEAMSPAAASPYDRNRDGLTLGEAAGAVLLTSGRAARDAGLTAEARLCGWGSSMDASHITAPTPDGAMLASAIACALDGLPPERVGCVLGHGTGTRYNDEAELRALRRIFPTPCPLASVKGGCGHTLGASGVIQACMIPFLLRSGTLFPQTNLKQADPLAEGMVFPEIRTLKEPCVLSMNSGFGGLNTVLRFEA